MGKPVGAGEVIEVEEEEGEEEVEEAEVGDEVIKSGK